jgi:protocatechuate 3,4-dioxygenase beta subunit
MQTHKLAISLVLSAALVVGLVCLLVWGLRGSGDPAAVSRPTSAPESPPPIGTTLSGGDESASAAAAVESTQAGATPPAAAEPLAPELADTRPVSIEGQVSDAQGAGVAGARVLAVARSKWEEPIRTNRRRLERDPFQALAAFDEALRGVAQGLPATRTREDGGYELRGLDDGDYRVVVMRDGFLPHNEESWVWVETGLAARYDVELVAGQAISGTVVDQDGKPIAGAVVLARLTDVAGLRGIGKLVQTLIDQSQGRLLVETDRTESDANGAFRLGSLEPRLHDLRVEKDGFAWSEVRKVPAGTGGITITVSPAPQVRGRVLSPDREPLAGAQVTLREPPKDFRKLERNPLAMAAFDADFLGETTRRATTTDGGSFEIGALKAGPYELVVEAEGYAPHRGPVGIEGAAVEVGDVVLQSLEPISGRVLGPDGSPVAGASVFVLDPRASADRGAVEGRGIPRRGPGDLDEDTTEGDGSFDLLRVPPGTYSVAVTAPGFVGRRVEQVRTGTRDLVVTLVPGETISGVVVDAADRRPVVGATVQEGFRSGNLTTTDARGRFTLRGIDRGDSDAARNGVHLNVEHEDYQQLFQGLQVPRGGSFQDLELELQRARGVEGVVLDPRGQPVKGARVWVEVPGFPPAILMMDPQGGGGTAFTGDDGAFFLKVPRMGPSSQVEVIAVYSGYAKARHGPIQTGGGPQQQRVEIRLAEGSAIEGRITDTTGAAVAGAQVGARRNLPLRGEALLFATLLPPSAAEVAYSAPDGTYRLRSLEPGTYQVTVLAIGYARKQLSPVEVGAAPARLDVVLDAGGSIRGRVVDHRQEPLVGIEVVAFLELDAAGDRAGSFEGRRGGMGRREEEMMLLGGVGSASTKTDDRGSYVLTHLPEGKFRVVARAAGYDPAELRDVESGEAADLVLAPFARLRGRVVDAASGAAVNAFQLSLDAKSDEGSWREDWKRRREVAQAEGHFEYEDLRAGEYRVRARSPGYGAARREVTLLPGQEIEVEIALELGLRVEGVVYSADSGATIAGATIRLYARNQGGIEDIDTSSEGRSGGDGRFELSGLASGECEVWVTHPDYYVEAGSSGVKLQLPMEEPRALEFPMRLAGRLEGRIRGLRAIDRSKGSYLLRLEREPPAESTRPEDSAAEPQPPAESTQAWIHEDGNYSAVSLKPGKYRVGLQSHTWRIDGDNAPPQPTEPVPLGEIEVRAGETARFDSEAR